MKKILNKSLFSTILAVVLALPLSITPVAAENGSTYANNVYTGVTLSSGNATVSEVTDQNLINAAIDKINNPTPAAKTLFEAGYDPFEQKTDGARGYHATFKLSNGSGDVTLKVPKADNWGDMAGSYLLVSTYSNGTWTPIEIALVDDDSNITVPYVDADMYLASFVMSNQSLSYYASTDFYYPVKTTAGIVPPSVNTSVIYADGVNFPYNTYVSLAVSNDKNSKEDTNYISLKNAAAKLALPPTQMASFDFDVKVTAFNADTNEITLDINPTYSVIDVTTGKKVSAGNKADVLKSSTDPIAITLYLGDYTKGLDKVYVKHVKDDGKTYVYTANVDKYNATTFVDYHGFSSFTISKNLPAGVIATDNNGTGYTTLQDAVDSVPNNGTITLADPNAALTAVVNREVTFTLAGANVKITAGNGYQLAKNGNVYTVTKTPAKATGTTGKKASPKTGVVLD